MLGVGCYRCNSCCCQCHGDVEGLRDGLTIIIGVCNRDLCSTVAFGCDNTLLVNGSYGGIAALVGYLTVIPLVLDSDRVGDGSATICVYLAIGKGNDRNRKFNSNLVGGCNSLAVSVGIGSGNGSCTIGNTLYVALGINGCNVRVATLIGSRAVVIRIGNVEGIGNGALSVSLYLALCE